MQYPRISIRLNNQEQAKLELTSIENYSYVVAVNSRGGTENLKLVFENDYVNTDLQTDKNAIIRTISFIQPRQMKHQLTESWQLLPPYEATAYDSSTPFPLLTSKDKFEFNENLPTGRAEFVIRARADLMGNEPTRMDIRLDNDRVETLEFQNTEIHEIHVSAKRWNGQKHIVLALANDAYNAQTLQDRNIFLYSVKIRYPQSLAIFQPQQANGEYLYRITQNRPIHHSAQISGDTRDSLMIPAGTQVMFPIEVNERSQLEFGYAAKCDPGTNCQLHLRVDSNSFILPNTLVSADLTGNSSWKDMRIDLGRFHMKRMELRFHVTGHDGEVVISNPIVRSH